MKNWIDKYYEAFVIFCCGIGALFWGAVNFPTGLGVMLFLVGIGTFLTDFYKQKTLPPPDKKNEEDND